MRIRRLKLIRDDGKVYLNRWGFRTRWFGVYLHRIESPDPGDFMHDHPWSFVSLILRGGYVERRCLARDVASPIARRGSEMVRHYARHLNRVRLDECHQIIAVEENTWTLVLSGPVRREWGFYTTAQTGWTRHDALPRSARGIEELLSKS